MPTAAELSSNLLQEAANFFQMLASQNEEIKPQMEENATVFAQMAQLLIEKPTGEIDGHSHAEMASKLMKDAANIFHAIAEQNEPIKEQLDMNATVFVQMADRLLANPTEEIG